MGDGIVTVLVRRWKMFVVAAAAAAGLATLFTGAGAGIDEQIAFARAGFRLHQASGEVVIIGIDAKSIEEIQHWPWPRTIHAQAVDRLRSAGAKLIAFDVDFSSFSEPSADARFAEALQRASGSVILPTFQHEVGGDGRNDAESAPIPLLGQAAFLASANVLPDADGRLRRMPFSQFILGAPRPSLASMAAERVGEGDGSFAIDMSLDPRSIPQYPMIDLISGRIPASALENKRVIIGATAVELGDRYAIPRHGLQPGVVIQAMAVESLLAGTAMAASGGWALVLALVIVVAASAAVRPRRRAAIAVVGLCSILGLNSLTEPWLALSFSLAPALAALLSAALTGAAAIVAHRFRERTLADAETGLPNLRALEAEAAAEPFILALAQIQGYSSLASALGPEAVVKLTKQLATRIAFAAGVERVYRLDEASLAWMEPAGTNLGGRFDAIAAIARQPLPDSPHSDLQLRFGAAAGSTDVRTLAANAGFAAARSQKEGTRWQMFSERDSAQVQQNVALLADFRRACAQGQVRNAYQPQLDLATRTVSGFESLVRWDHHRLGTISPDTFVPLLEQHGRALDLTLHVLGEAVEQALLWERVAGPVSVSINVSAVLLHDQAAMLRLQDALRGSGLPAARVVIEVTETAAMADPRAAIAALEGWRELGAGVSIDDYGTGQSSLSYLQQLPATELKIDKSFVATLAEEPRNAIMVRSTIAMAHELGLKVVAEGVEDERCLSLLAAMGCDMVQGYYVARPFGAEAATAFLSDWNASALRQQA